MYSNNTRTQPKTNSRKPSRKNRTKSHTACHKIFVGGIPPDTDREELFQFFSSIGEVVSVDVPVNRKKGTIKGFAFVSFAHEATLQKVLAQGFFTLRGKRMAVSEALSASEASRKTKMLQNQKLFVKGLPPKTTAEQLKEFFAGFGPVELAILPKKNRGSGKGIAYVVMQQKQDFDRVVAAQVLDFYGFEVEVIPARSPKEMENDRKQKPGNSSPPRSILANSVSMNPQYDDSRLSHMSQENSIFVNEEGLGLPQHLPQPYYPKKGAIYPYSSSSSPSERPKEEGTSHSNSSSSGSKRPDNYVLNYPPNFNSSQPIWHASSSLQPRTDDHYSQRGLTGPALMRVHGLAMLKHKKPLRNPQAPRTTSNNGKKVVTVNHQAHDYLCNLQGGRFADQQVPMPAREHHFGPANHFGQAQRESQVNTEGVTHYGPNFGRRPMEEFFRDYQESSDTEEVPTIEIKQTVTTKYAISSEGMIFTGTVNEVNVWGEHPHTDNRAEFGEDEAEEDMEFD